MKLVATAQAGKMVNEGRIFLSHLSQPTSEMGCPGAEEGKGVMTSLLQVQAGAGSQYPPFLQFFLEEAETCRLLTLENCTSHLPLLTGRLVGIL